MKRAHIVVATDKKPVGRRIAEDLTDGECDVLLRETPVEFAEFLHDGDGDVLVLDLLMLDGTGFCLFQACRDHRKSLPVITFTQCPGGPAKVTLGRPAADTDWGSTPVDLAYILEHVRACLETA